MYLLQESKGVRSQGDKPPCTITFPVTNEQKGEDPNCSEREPLAYQRSLSNPGRRPQNRRRLWTP